jgi:SAM-dependent methyltransferase
VKNPETWRASKYVRDKNGLLTASRNPLEVGVGSRFIADIIAQWYDSVLKQYAGGRLLDLGCGKSPLYLVYKNLVNDITLVDWENSLHPNEHLDFSCDLTKALPFKDNEFDTIILSDVLEHIPEPEFLFSEIARILNTDGILLMNVPFFYWIHEAPHDYYRYTEFKLRDFAEKSGLSLVSCSCLGGVFTVLIDIMAKILAPRGRCGEFCSKTLQAIAKKILKNKMLSHPEFPLVYAMICKKEAST